MQGNAISSPASRNRQWWRASYLLLAPHRLGFFLAIVVLVTASIWWTLVLTDRATAGLTLAYVMPPTLGHSAIMTFGFMPLFFSGFLFTAGPKWLGVEPLEIKQILVPLLLLTLGWLLWIFGQHTHVFSALLGLVFACAGLVWITALFWRLIKSSTVNDQLHPRVIGVAFGIGSLCASGLLICQAFASTEISRVFVLSGLWGFTVPVYVSVAHRMIPFFTSSAMPFINAKRPFWALGLLLGVSFFELFFVWLEFSGLAQTSEQPTWVFARGIIELTVGLALLWLTAAWGFMQSLKNRLLAMLHIGFLWFGLSFVLGGVAQLLNALNGSITLPLGSLHALTMGGLGSLMLAMVTRVSCGHSGRPLVVDKLIWILFCLLQVGTLVRISAAHQGAYSEWLLLIAAWIWMGIALLWGSRLANWYGHLRVDGRSG